MWCTCAIASSVPCAAADALGFPWLLPAERLLFVEFAGLDALGASMGCLTLAITLLSALGTRALVHIDCADCGDSQHCSLLHCEAQAPGKGICFPSLRIGEDRWHNLALLGCGEPWRPYLNPMRNVPARMCKAGEVVECHCEIIAACIIVGQRRAISTAEQDGEIIEPERHQLHGRAAAAPSRLLLGREDFKTRR